MHLFFYLILGAIVLIFVNLLIVLKYIISFKKIINKVEENSKMDLNLFYSSIDNNNNNITNAINKFYENLEKVNQQIQGLDKARALKENNLINVLNNLSGTHKDVMGQMDLFRKETMKVISALKKPTVRGQLGEMQLKRIAEISGMLPFCDFTLQDSITPENRPDMVVKLPNNGIIIVDAKTPLDSFLNFLDHEDEEKFGKEVLKAIKQHIYSLAQKKYWVNQQTPEFVVMFIPNEAIWLRASELDQSLIEYAAQRNIVLATPMTLIALLKTIFLGWKHIYLARDVVAMREKMSDLMELNDKLIKLHKNNCKATLALYHQMEEQELYITKIQKCLEDIKNPTMDSQINDSQINKD